MATLFDASAETQPEKYEQESESSCNESLDLEGELSPEAFAALTLFMAEKEENARLPAVSENRWVSEDFGLSQFWYSVETAEAIAKEIQDKANGGHIALMSAPKAMVGFKNIDPCRDNLYIFEYDRRFAEVYPIEYVYFDFNEPELVPEHLHHSFDFIHFDPPYLNANTLKKYKQTLELLAKYPLFPKDENSPRTLLMAVSGAILEEEYRDMFGMRPVECNITFESKLATPMQVYTNFASGLGPWRKDV